MFHSEDTGTQRCFGHQMARELTQAEIASISGGASYTGITNFQWLDQEGNCEFSYTDYEP